MIWAAALWAVAAVAWAQTPVDETKPAEAQGWVDIRNIAGSIDVVGWDRNEIQVTGTLGKGVERLRFEVDGKRTTVHVMLPDNTRHAGKTELTIKVPATSTVDLDCVSGEIRVNGATGPLKLSTVSGSIKATGFQSTVEAQTVSGSIDLEGASNELDAQTVSGSISITKATGRVEASTISGTIDVSGENVSRLKCKNVSGGASFEGSVAEHANVDMNSQSGSVTVRLPETTSAVFDASTFSGGIHNGLTQDAPVKQQYGPGTSLGFTMGSGSAHIQLKAFSGSVNLAKH
jgi:DUF4097 and DUF4098 domain-containing protein YvlB